MLAKSAHNAKMCATEAMMLFKVEMQVSYLFIF